MYYLAFGIAISWRFGTNIEIHNNGLPGEGKLESFYLNVCRIIGNFHFSTVPVGTLGLISLVRKGQISFGGVGQRSVTYKTHAALPRGYSVPVAE